MNEQTEQIAWILTQKYGSKAFAWVEHEKNIYYAVLDKAGKLPVTAVTQLIQYLFDRYIDHSFFILRNRIFTTENLTDVCRAMVKLTAKRITGGIEPRNHDLENSQTWIQVCGSLDGILESQHQQIDFLSTGNLRKESAKNKLQEIIAGLDSGPVLHDFNRKIAAILCDSDGNILETSKNNNSKNKTLHAEVLLVQRYFQRHGRCIPENAVIYTSLKPCRMCAEMILNFCKNREMIQIYYLNDDPGPMAKNTILERKNILRAFD